MQVCIVPTEEGKKRMKHTHEGVYTVTLGSSVVGGEFELLNARSRPFGFYHFHIVSDHLF